MRFKKPKWILMSNLNHLAIIMDGNGRWAENKKLSRTEGHKMGSNVVRDISSWCAKSNISFLSLFAFSTENWERPKLEVDFLMRLLEKYLVEELPTYEENNICFRVIGDISFFKSSLQKLIIDLEDRTKNNTALTQILALNYGAKDEISRAILKVFNYINEQNLLHLNKFDMQKLIENNLDTADFPPVDLLIRTGGEQRISNFLLWQCAYAELYFSKTLFPDFNSFELEKIIEDYSTRNRRFGRL